MSSSNQASRGYRPPTYGNWRKPKTVGLLNLSMPATIVLIGLVVLAVFLMMVTNFLVAVIFLLFGFVVLELLSVQLPSGFTPAGKVLLAIKYRRLKAKGENVHIGGLLRRKTPQLLGLPGVGVDFKLSEHTDNSGRKFALVKHGKSGVYSIIFKCVPDGLSLVDPQSVDVWVAYWGAFLADLGYETGLESVSCTIETAPDTGARLRREMSARITSDSSPVSRLVVEDLVNTYPAGSAETLAYVALTYSAALRVGGKARKDSEVAHDLASRIPALTRSLSLTGAGNSRPVTADELCKIIRVAYDPSSADLFAQAAVTGQKVDLTWNNVGPVTAVSNWDSYRHEAARSYSWEMMIAPRGIVRSDVLSGLLAPNSQFLRKRVTLIYKPLASGDAAKTADNDDRHASAAVNSASKNKARLRKEQAAARQSAEEEASGAGLEEFGMVVTVTVPPDTDRADVMSVVDSLAATSRIRLRFAYGQQDSMFALALPLGIVPARYSMVPEGLREALA